MHPAAARVLGHNVADVNTQKSGVSLTGDIFKRWHHPLMGHAATHRLLSNQSLWAPTSLYSKPLGIPRLRAAWGLKNIYTPHNYPSFFFYLTFYHGAFAGHHQRFGGAVLQVWYCATDFHPHHRAENNWTEGRLIWCCNHWRWHLEFTHKLIASFKQLKIYSQSKKHNGCQARRLVLCVPALPLPLKKACFWLSEHKKFEDKYYSFLLHHDAHVAKCSSWDSSVFIKPSKTYKRPYKPWDE